MLSFFRKYHKWIGIIATLFILFFAVSGIILNHRGLLSGVDISRKALPPVYRYNNWNLAAVKGAVEVSPDSILLFGNIGVWRTDTLFRSFGDMNAGFPGGIDNRKINSLCFSERSGLYAGTLFGLYNWNAGAWQKLELPEEAPRIVKVLQAGDSLMVMSRSKLWFATSSSGYRDFTELPLPKGEDDDGKVGMFKTLWVIHSGEIYGLTGKLIVDAVGLAFIIICITGLIFFFMPTILKRVKRPERRSWLKRFNRNSLRWHNVLGSWGLVILLLNTATGIFLRPPLLIPIANERVGKIRYTELDDPNPWFDRLRDIIHDPSLNRFLIATSEGIYYSDDLFRSELKVFPHQPPVSVMGINVFKRIGEESYLVGSFSGIFEWNAATGATLDAITRTRYHAPDGSGPPFGSVTVAGYMVAGDSTRLIFDYAHGVMALSGRNPLPPFPKEITANSPMSLWNTCLEIHTGRIFEPVLGPFYILVVPLVGLSTLFILVSGFFAWWLPKRRKAVAAGTVPSS